MEIIADTTILYSMSFPCILIFITCTTLDLMNEPAISSPPLIWSYPTGRKHNQIPLQLLFTLRYMFPRSVCSLANSQIHTFLCILCQHIERGTFGRSIFPHFVTIHCEGEFAGQTWRSLLSFTLSLPYKCHRTRECALVSYREVLIILPYLQAFFSSVFLGVTVPPPSKLNPLA